jgi:hypothetical protein
LQWLSLRATGEQSGVLRLLVGRGLHKPQLHPAYAGDVGEELSGVVVG